MNFKEFIFGKDTKTNTDAKIEAKQPTLKTAKSSEVQNPYTKGAEGRKEWNDRYMNMAKSIRNWQFAFVAVAVLAFIELIILAKLATQSKIQPYVVETNQGIPYSIKAVTGVSDKDQLLINYAVNQFVINAKTIIADTTAEKTLLDNVYAFSAGGTYGFLQDFYAKNNPYDLAGSYTVTVNIINSLPVGNNTWQVIWEEIKHNVNSGEVMETTKWVGHFTYQFGQVNPKSITKNPFGIYVTNLTWSQSQ
jgi:type IV secretion system protein TrbF